MQAGCQVPGPCTSPPQSAGWIVCPQRKAQVHKGPVIFGPAVPNNIPGSNANNHASAGVRGSWLAPAIQIHASQSTGVSPALARYLSSRSLNSRAVNPLVVVEGGGFCAPAGTLCCSSLDYWCQEGRGQGITLILTLP